MSTETADLGPFDPAKQPREGSDTSFEVELDEEPPRRHEPVYVDVVSRDEELLPIVPANWRTLDNARASLRRIGVRWWHIARWHAVRAPWHGLLLAWFALIGVFRLAGRQLRWWWVSEQDELRQRAATDNEPEAWSRLTAQARAIRLYRGLVLLGEVVALVALLAVLHFAPGWVLVLLVLVAVPVLARAGRPGRRVIGSAVVASRFRKLNSDIVLRAYYAAGLGHPDKPGQKVEFLSTMARDTTDQGSQVLVALAHGRTFTEAMNAREKIASGLDVALSQVYLTRDKQSNRSHHLYVSDVDPLSIPAGRSPLLDCKVRDIWTAAPLGLDERGRRVNLPLLFHSVLVGAQPRKGKALALDTKVPTPSGWTTMGELRDGDLVYDEAGTPCRVVAAHDVRYDRSCYEVRFSDGSTVIADADHLWQVDTRASRLSAQQQGRWRKAPSPFGRDQQHKRARAQVLTTAEMLGAVRIQADGRTNYSVRVAAPIQAEDADLLVPPYTLGAWLGDGTSIHGAIACADVEIIARIEQEGERTGLNPSSVKDGRCPYYRVYGLQPRLRTIGVLGNKHIPVTYLRASEQQRRALLAGLLDTDGFCQQGTGVVYFAVTSERLARDARHLVSTLGYKSTLNVKPVKLNGRDRGWQWVVTFTPSDKVFGLARKADRQVKTMKASAGHRFITEIRTVPSVPVRCITVDSPSSLYLVGETCIPTHNTFSARSLALFAALDPFVRLSVFDGKGSPDWRKFALVAWSFGFGLLPDRIQGDPLETLVWTLQQIKQDILRRNVKLSELPTSICPEGKLTRDIARDTRFGMPVWMLILDEFQEFLNSGDDERDLVVADLLVFIVKVGPSVGIIPIDSTQRPSGIGSTGKVAKRFTDFRDNHLTRLALKTGSWQVSDLVLGAGAYSEGYDSSALPSGDGSDGGYDYRGIGILYDSPVGNATVRTYLADGQDAEKILLAARAVRERTGTLDGMAAGEEVARDLRDVLRDVRSVFYAGEAWVSWPQIAARLAEQMPEHYVDMTAETASAQVRALKVPSVDGRDKADGNRVVKGAKLKDIDAAMKRRELADA